MQLSENSFIQTGRVQVRTQLNQILWFITPTAIDKSVSNMDHKKIIDAICSGNCIDAERNSVIHRLRTRDTIKSAL